MEGGKTSVTRLSGQEGWRVTVCRKTSHQLAFVVGRYTSAHVENTGVRSITALGMDVT
jgi:hypothetical protein